MIFFKLFLVFSKIGIVNFGGGYAMLSLIQDEVVRKEGWLSSGEFTDIVAYVGYTSVLNDGYPPLMAILGSFIATLSVLWLPFLLMIGISRYLLRHKDSPFVRSIFSGLRPTIVGLVAAAALVLMNVENFGAPREATLQFVISIILFALAFVASYRFKTNPLLLLAVAGGFGMLFYSFVPV